MDETRRMRGTCEFKWLIKDLGGRVGLLVYCNNRFDSVADRFDYKLYVKLVYLPCYARLLFICM